MSLSGSLCLTHTHTGPAESGKGVARGQRHWACSRRRPDVCVCGREREREREKESERERERERERVSESESTGLCGCMWLACVCVACPAYLKERVGKKRGGG